MGRLSYVRKSFAVVVVTLSLCIGAFSLSGCSNNSSQVQGELDQLKQEVAATREENENLRKQVEILSSTVKQLSELNALLQKEQEGKEGKGGE